MALDGVPEVLGNAALLVDERPGLLERLVERRVGVVVGVVQLQAVGQRDVLVLGVDELDDVRVRDPHDRHLGAAARPALGDGLAHLVERLHERERPRRDSAGRADGVAVGAQPPEGVAHPAAGLEHLGGLLGRLVDVSEVVGGRVDETRRELLEFVAGVHQRGRVRHERQRRHQLPVLGGDRLDVVADGLGEVGDDGLVGELVDVLRREVGLDVVLDGGPLAEDLRGEFVPARMVGFDLGRRDGDRDVLVGRLVGRLRERDVARDASEQVLLVFDEIAFGIAAKIAGGQDVPIGVRGETVLQRLAGDTLDGKREVLGGRAVCAHLRSPSNPVDGTAVWPIMHDVCKVRAVCDPTSQRSIWLGFPAPAPVVQSGVFRYTPNRRVTSTSVPQVRV